MCTRTNRELDIQRNTWAAGQALCCQICTLATPQLQRCWPQPPLPLTGAIYCVCGSCSGACNRAHSQGTNLCPYYLCLYNRTPLHMETHPRRLICESNMFLLHWWLVSSQDFRIQSTTYYQLRRSGVLFLKTLMWKLLDDVCIKVNPAVFCYLWYE